MKILKAIVKLLRHIPAVDRCINKAAINRVAYITPPRPRPYSLFADYTTWRSLTDKSFSGRHLPPANRAWVDQLPEDQPFSETTIGDVTALFRREGQQKDAPRSSILFAFFVQWFCDSFLRIDGTDRRKNTSNHHIDLCQIYGLTEQTTQLLRYQPSDGGRSFGKLQFAIRNGEIYPDTLFEQDESDGTWHVKARYRDLPYVNTEEKRQKMLSLFPGERAAHAYAAGLDRGNSTVVYTAISTLFLREHNRLCDELFKRNPHWDDDRLFQTARNINIVLLLKIIIEDYINFIANRPGFFKVDNRFPEKETWYRENWIALEFDLLYRWHSMVPDSLTVQGNTLPHTDYRNNNAVLEEAGLGALLQAAATQPAGRGSLFNTPAFLLGAEYQAIKMGRDFRLRSFNDYRQQFGLKPLASFAELTPDTTIQQTLTRLYGDINNLEYFVGLFAEAPKDDNLWGDLLTVMVATDAFTQALTNPLLSKNIFNAQTFTDYGLEMIAATNSLRHLVERNVKNGASYDVSFAL